MKSLRDIFKAAKILKSMSTRQERKAMQDFEAERCRQPQDGNGVQKSVDSFANIQDQESCTIAPTREAVFASGHHPLSEEGQVSASTGKAFAEDDSFSLADLINHSADNQEDLSLPDISLDSSLAEIADVEDHPSAVGKVDSGILDGDDDDDEVPLPHWIESLELQH